MTPSEFISASVRGGWKPPAWLQWADEDLVDRYMCEILLDPLAWSAVGKDRGWEETEMQDEHRPVNGKSEAHNRQLKFVSLLQDGQTLLGALRESTI